MSLKGDLAQCLRDLVYNLASDIVTGDQGQFLTKTPAVENLKFQTFPKRSFQALFT